MGRFFARGAANLEDIGLTMKVFAAEGANVAVAGRRQGRVKHTSKRIDSPLVRLWTVRDDKVVSCLETTDTASEAAACV